MAKILELRRHMSERRISVAQISQMLGISQSTFYRLMETNGERFTIDQVKRLGVILSLKSSEIVDIFFA